MKYLRAVDAKKNPDTAAVRAAVAAEWRQARAVNPAVARLLWRRTRAYEKAWEAIMEEIWSDSTAYLAASEGLNLNDYAVVHPQLDVVAIVTALRSRT